MNGEPHIDARPGVIRFENIPNEGTEVHRKAVVRACTALFLIVKDLRMTAAEREEQAASLRRARGG